MSATVAAISHAHSERIYTLWDELAAFEVTRHDEALDHLLRTLCELTDAQNATWFGAVRLPEVAPNDPILGWRPRFYRLLHPDPKLDAVFRQQAALLEQREVDVNIVCNVALARRLRANRLEDSVPPEWFESDYYRKYFLDLGRVDAIWAGCPVNADAEIYFGLFRAVGKPRFTAAERDIVYAALRSLKWFHRQYLLSHGLLVASSPLTTVEREVLRGLLSGKTEKEIAVFQGRGLHTTHEYVKALYRKFRVTSRAALMALWLGQLT